MNRRNVRTWKAVSVLVVLTMLVLTTLFSARAPVALAANTGWLNPAANGADTGGDGNGFETNPTYAYANGAPGAAVNNNGYGDRHRYYNYGITIPAGATIGGIEVRVDGRVIDSIAGVSDYDIELSWNTGTNWTTAYTTDELSQSEQTFTLGSATDNWGHDWTATQLGNTNFRVRITSSCSGSGSDNCWQRDFELDWIAVRVTYNRPPVAVADSYSTPEDTPLTVAAPGVLTNDTDPDGDPMTAVLDTGPASGTLTLNANGSFTYTPASNYNGVVTFTYHANDGTADSNVATVTITVTAVNDAPVAVNDGYSTPEDTPLNVAAPGVLTNDTDAEGDPLTAVLDAGPASGTLTLNADGSFTYTPASNYNGVVTFTYHANDGTADSNVATVTITVTAVNDAPVAVADGYSTPEDTPLTVAAPGVLTNDTDAEGDPLTAVLDAGPASGTLTLNADGSFTYTPASNYNGVVTFTYHANDGTADSNVATVTITVTAVNDAPVAVADGYATLENTPLNVGAALGVLANDTDADGDPLTAVLDAGPASGTLVLNTDGSFVYTPAPSFNGDVTFTYHANDGTADSNTATVTITVQATNNAPVAVADGYSTPEDTRLTVGAALGVLANDTDADGNTLMAVLDAGPASGTLVLNTDGSFVYTPTLNFNGVVTFTYHASDGIANSNTATVTITITALNDAPAFTSTPVISATEDVAYTYNVTVADVDNAVLTITAPTRPGWLTLTDHGDGTATLTGIPTHTDIGDHPVVLRVSDGAATTTQPFTITVSAKGNYYVYLPALFKN